MKTQKNEFCQETQEWCREYSNANVLSSIPTMDLDDRLRAVEKHLALATPTEEMMDKYPALREAYEQFRIIYRITAEHEKTN